MSAFDLTNGYQLGQTLTPKGRAATVNGTGVDFRDCGPDVTGILSLYAVSGTDPTLNLKLQESDDDGDADAYADIDGATLSEKTASHASSAANWTTFRRSKRYVRAVATIGGSSPSFTFGVTLLSRKVSY